MKIQRNLYAGFILLTLFTTVCGFSQGFIVPNGVYLDPNFQNAIGVVHYYNPPYFTQATGFALIPDPSTPPNFPLKKFTYDPFTDIGVEVFLVSPNDPISLQAILSMNYSELDDPANDVLRNGVPFYVGLYTGNSYPVNGGGFGDPSFGWAELANVNGTIQLLGGAIEYQGGGIYAGTETIIPVPEPRACGILGLVAGMFFWRKGVKLMRLKTLS